MSIETGSQLQEFSDEGIFGTVSCKECHTIWAEEFVPEFCTRCGTRVSMIRSEGFEGLVNVIERANIPLKIFACPYCGERYLKKVYPEKCFRCWHYLRSPGPAGWLIRMFSRLLRH